MIRPSGSHSTSSGSYCHSPSRFCGVPPAASTTKMRSGAVRVTPERYASRRLSGDQTGWLSLPLAVVIRRGVPPAAGITKMSVSLRGASSRFAS